MPPKVKITKEDIINASVEIVRREGAQAINARTVASMLDCSTQPVFSNFSSMMEMKLAVVQRANEICSEYIEKEISSGKFPAYKASGIAYIRFAKEEKELFKLLYMRDRTNENDSGANELDNKMENIVQGATGLDGDNAKLFHLEMWAYVHGIAVMVATGFEDLDFELVSRMMTDVYRGLRKQFGME